MLVLSRKPNQKIQIGEDIVVTIVAVGGSRVKLAIEAPREVAIRRGELQSSPAQLPEMSMPLTVEVTAAT